MLVSMRGGSITVLPFYIPSVAVSASTTDQVQNRLRCVGNHLTAFSAGCADTHSRSAAHVLHGYGESPLA